MSPDPFGEALRARGVVIGHQDFPLSSSRLAVEPPALLTKRFRADLPVSVGAFSMVHGEGDLAQVALGRYCSIAPRAVLGGNEHATGWLSSSSLMENTGLVGWRDLVASDPGVDERRGRPYRRSVRPITVGHDVWIGDGAFVRGGVVIGDGAVVGARAVVLHDVPPYAIVAGNPAEVVRMRFDEAVVERMLAFRWWRYSFDDLHRVDVTDPAAALAGLAELEAAGRITPYHADLLTPAPGAPTRS